MTTVEHRRLLHVVGDSGFGGASQLISRLAMAAAQDGWEVAVLATDKRFVRHLRGVGVNVQEVDVIRRSIRPLRDLMGLVRLTRHLRNGHYDVVHTHTSKAGFIGRAAACLAQTPVIVHTAHGFAIHERSKLFVRIPYLALERLAGAWCDVVVLVSEFHREWAQRLRLAPPEKLISIVNGVDADAVKPSTHRDVVRASLDVSPRTVLVLSTSRIAPGKGIDDLIQAVARLDPAARVRIQVLFAGDGPSRSTYEGLAVELGVSEHTRFLGFRSDVGDLLGAADIVVLASLREGMPISLLEAMANGVAIIGSTIGPIREALDGVGLLVPPAAPDELAAALALLVGNQAECARYGELARLRHQARYQEKDMVSSYLALYDHVVARKAICGKRRRSS